MYDLQYSMSGVVYNFLFLVCIFKTLLQTDTFSMQLLEESAAKRCHCGALMV